MLHLTLIGKCNNYCTGGSEKFQDKRQYFYKEVCKLSKPSRKEQVIKVSRSRILEDVS